MPRTPEHSRGRLRTALAGIAWGHLSLAAAARLAAGAGAPELHATGHPAVSAAAWLLLAPLSASAALLGGGPNPAPAMLTGTLPLFATPLPALVGCGLALLARAGARRVPRGAAIGVAVLLALLAASLSGAAGRAVIREREGERLFIEHVAVGDEPWRHPAPVAAARRLVADLPGTRWESEAWRTIALAAEHDGRTADALAAWDSFEESLGPGADAGRAYAAFARAGLLERAGSPHRATREYRTAARLVMTSGLETQAWLAAESATAAARIAMAHGRGATATDWSGRAAAYRVAAGSNDTEERP